MNYKETFNLSYGMVAREGGSTEPIKELPEIKESFYNIITEILRLACELEKVAKPIKVIGTSPANNILIDEIIRLGEELDRKAIPGNRYIKLGPNAMFHSLPVEVKNHVVTMLNTKTGARLLERSTRLTATETREQMRIHRDLERKSRADFFAAQEALLCIRQPLVFVNAAVSSVKVDGDEHE